MQTPQTTTETTTPSAVVMTSNQSRKPSKAVSEHLSAYGRYATECQIYGIQPRPIGEWYSLPSEGTAEMKHERRIAAENATAKLTAETTLVVAKPAHQATTVRKMRTLAEKRAEWRTKRALRVDRLRSAVDRVAEVSRETVPAVVENPSPNRPKAREQAMAERERWIVAVMPQICEALDMTSTDGVRIARTVAEAWLERKELDTEKRISRAYQARIWEAMPSSRWKGMEMGQTPEDNLHNHQNGLRRHTLAVTSKDEQEMLAWIRQEANRYGRYTASGNVRPKVTIRSNGQFLQRISQAKKREKVEVVAVRRGLLFPSVVNPMMEA